MCDTNGGMKAPRPSWQQASARDAVLLAIETIPRFYKKTVMSIEDVPHTILPAKTHYRLLGILRFRPGLSLTELARSMDMAKTNVSPLVEKLVQAGLVSRQQDPGDRRLTALSLSQAGVIEYEAGIAVLQKAFGGCFSGMGEEEGQRFGEALATVLSGFSRLMETGQSDQTPEL